MRPLPFRKCLAATLAATLALASSGCRRAPEGVLQVVVIGNAPKLAEPQNGPLTTADALLVNNVAQPLVRFDARGQIVPGLAETWNVSDDGLSYIFRLANQSWPNGRKITADQVARMLRRLIGRSSRDPMKDSFGAVEDIVGMTDRVLEIRLQQPRPHLLQLLAQPEMGLVFEGQGTGPFTIDRGKSRDGVLRLTREIATPDEEQTEREELDLSAGNARQAIEAFLAGNADLVLGGTFVDLPLAPRERLSRRALQFDPAAGLFGLAPARSGGPLDDADLRHLLSQAIDRDALIASLSVPGLSPRATVLEPGLDNIADPAAPPWAATPVAERLPELQAAAQRLFAGKAPTLKLALPEGPGADILMDRLTADWGAIGIRVERANKGGPADLELVDEVAPSTSASWYVRHFRCSVAPICDEEIDTMLEGARTTPVLAQRSALLTEASRRIDSLQLFIPIAAPIRWSLLSPRVTGFAGNRFAIHTLTGLEQRLDRTGE